HRGRGTRVPDYSRIGSVVLRLVILLCVVRSNVLLRFVLLRLVSLGYVVPLSFFSRLVLLRRVNRRNVLLRLVVLNAFDLVGSVVRRRVSVPLLSEGQAAQGEYENEQEQHKPGGMITAQRHVKTLPHRLPSVTR